MIDDKKLRDVLLRKISQINEFPKSAFFEVRDLLSTKYNVDYGVSTDIFNGREPMDTLPYHMLYKLAVCIKEVDMSRWEQLDTSDLYIPKYFTEQDIIDFDKPLTDKNINKDLVISNWLQVNSDQFVCVVPVEQLVEWRNLNRIKYNPRTQRRLTEKVNKGVVYKVITLFGEALDAIRELMSNNEFISDDITFNIDPTFYEPPKISRDKLVIPKDSVIDIIDGFHRLKEMLEVKDFNLNWTYNCIVNIVMFDEAKANKFILQRDKKNHLTEEQTEQMDQNSEINFILNKLNDSNKFHLKRTIIDRKFDVIRKVMDNLFALDDKKNKKDSFQIRRQKSVEVYNKIETYINHIVEVKNLFDQEFTVEMWVAALYLIYYSVENSIDFELLFDKVDFDMLVNGIVFKNYPTTQNYKFLKEAINNAQDN